MASGPTRLIDEFGLALANLADSATGLVSPTLRLGVTGLSRAGKTIFITALVHALLTRGRLPGFRPMAEGRLLGAKLVEYPDATVPRFAYEQHLAALTARDPVWPESTRRISQLRIALRFARPGWFGLPATEATLNLDIVDYPGEWLLDLPLLSMNFAQWSEEAIGRARRPGAADDAAAFLSALERLDTTATAREHDAEALATSFTAYLRASRRDDRALSSLPPGRFLLPGDLEGSPALTFAPLPAPSGRPGRDSLYHLLEGRFEAYKDQVVRPFFVDHFLRLDRQVVLVDALRALNAGPEAVADLEAALTGILSCFRQGETNPLSRLVTRRIDRILFAATKADHLHSSNHDRLEAVLVRLVSKAARKARYAGADTRSLAIAAIRATREGVVEERGRSVPTIIGTPSPGERLGDTVYDGRTEIALFPGDLPQDPDRALDAPLGLNFLRFEPPHRLERTADGEPVLPHIRFDRALDHLIGDRLT